VYPLSVAAKSQASARVEAANSILTQMKKHSDKLVNQAQLVSRELIRVAILWHEMWHEGLEEASRLYFGNRDVDGMFKKLEPLHTMLAKVNVAFFVWKHCYSNNRQKGPETTKEASFQQNYGRDLQEALEWCRVSLFF
jgi:FKBP12-rapamycin complex-associated protein